MELFIGGILVIWDFIKPFAIGFIIVITVVGVIKHSILDGITQRIEDAVGHLRAIEREAERVRELLYDVQKSITNIEKELDWWSDKHTLAKQIIERLDAIERK